MRTSSTSGGEPLKRSKAVNCVLLNQLAAPGLGSILGRRYFAGAVQLVLSLAGFNLVVVWFVQVFNRLLRVVNELAPVAENHPWAGVAGLLIFGIAWLLSGITSLSLLKEARQSQPELVDTKQPLPPKIR